MIVDIVELDFAADDLDSYYGSFPVVIAEPQMPDDVYFVGHDTCMSIPKRYYRYKLIEHISGVIKEHIILTGQRLVYPYKGMSRVEVYPVSTRVHMGHNVETFRYIKPINTILSRVSNNSIFNNGVKTVHQVILNTIYGFYQNDSRMSEVALFLTEYVKERQVELLCLATASISNTMKMMESVQEIHHALRVGVDSIGVTYYEMKEYIDQAIDLPTPDLHVGFTNIVMKCNVSKQEMMVSDFLPLLNQSSIGMYNHLLPSRLPNPSNKITSTNMHLASVDHRKNVELESSLIEVLNQLEICDYTDISIAIPYSEDQVPNIIIHYGGSIFNNGYMEHGNMSTINIDITKLFYILKQSYGESGYYINKPTINVCRTFAEEVYVTFSSDGVHAEHVECYDLTLMALLSPTIMDSQAERFVIANMGK